MLDFPPAAKKRGIIYPATFKCNNDNSVEKIDNDFPNLFVVCLFFFFCYDDRQGR